MGGGGGGGSGGGDDGGGGGGGDLSSFARFFTHSLTRAHIIQHVLTIT